MSEGFSAFKAVAIGLGFFLTVTSVAPNVADGQFDMLKLSKGKGRGKSTLPELGGTTGNSTGDVGSTPPPTTSNGFYSEETIVPSSFDVTSALQASWGTGQIPKSAAPDVVGAFRFICGAGQLSYDDPIMYPGQPGKAHLHQFYGNLNANANSTYSSLRSSGDSTCNFVGNGNAVNCSAYWMPAMLDGKGNAVRPDWVIIYYKQRPVTDPVVSDPANPSYIGKAIPLPNGLRFIYGWDPTGVNSARTGAAYFNCQGPSARAGHYPDLPTALANCPAGNQLGAIIEAPSCWDGKNLDSPDHRSHVAYPTTKCPATHPYLIPSFTLGSWYTVGQDDDPKLWQLSSDHMAPDKPKGYTFHADWFGAWDNTVMSMWWNNCINKMLNCSGGDLGNGKQLKGAAQPIYNGVLSWKHPQRLVAVP